MRTVSRASLGLFAFGLVALTAGGQLGAGEKKDKGRKVVNASTLKVGDKAPTFEAVDDQGKPWKSQEHVGKKVVVLYFFPAALTGG